MSEDTILDDRDDNVQGTEAANSPDENRVPKPQQTEERRAYLSRKKNLRRKRRLKRLKAEAAGTKVPPKGKKRRADKRKRAAAAAAEAASRLVSEPVVQAHTPAAYGHNCYCIQYAAVLDPKVKMECPNCGTPFTRFQSELDS